MTIFRMYKRPWNPMPGDEEGFPRKPDGTFEDVYILIVFNCVIGAGSYRDCFRKLPRVLKMRFYCWLVNNKLISQKTFRKWCGLKKRNSTCN